MDGVVGAVPDAAVVGSDDDDNENMSDRGGWDWFISVIDWNDEVDTCNWFECELADSGDDDDEEDVVVVVAAVGVCAVITKLLKLIIWFCAPTTKP